MPVVRREELEYMDLTPSNLQILVLGRPGRVQYHPGTGGGLGSVNYRLHPSSIFYT